MLPTLTCVLFWILIPAANADPSKIRQVQTWQVSEDGNYFSFATRQDIKAPVWDVKVLNDSHLTEGYWFIAPYEEKTQTVAGDAWVGPHIYDGNGDLVWSGVPTFGGWNVFDFNVAEINGVRHLSGLDWQNQRGIVLDDSYQILMTTPSVANLDTFQNMHGFTVVDNGRHGIVQTVRHWDVPADVTFADIGYNATCDANYEGFREMDLESPGGTELIFDWDGRKISLNESTYIKYDRKQSTMCDRGWDLLHVNAVDKCPDGDYLLSARHTDALYKISHLTGDIVWRLGGVRSDFVYSDDVKFTRQHDARCLKQSGNHTIVSLFDNAVGEHWQPASRRSSRGMVLDLNLQTMKASIVSQYSHPQGQLTDGRGSFQLLPNGNAFANWAKYSLISEHSPDGHIIFEASLKSKHDTYRAFKHPWVGRPNTLPDLHSEIVWLEHHKIATNVSMSWNGATEVAAWNVRGFDADGKEIDIASNHPRQGFETSLQYDGYATNVYAQALDRDGNVLGISRRTHSPQPVDPEAIEPGSPLPTAVAVALGVVGGVFGVLLAIAGFSAYRYVKQHRGLAKRNEKGSYAAVVQDEESWELAEESTEPRPLSPKPDPDP